MARLTDDKKSALKAAIYDHMRLHGPNGWDAVMQRFPDVSASTFHRLVKDVREQITNEAAEDSPMAVKLAQKQIRSRRPLDLEKVASETAMQIPCTPSPAIIASKRDRGLAYLRVLGVMDGVLADGEKIRAWSVAVDPDGNERIKNPTFFLKSASLRMATAKGYLDALAQAYDMEKMQEFYAVVMEEIGKASPEVQLAILSRLRAANAAHAMTVEAKL